MEIICLPYASSNYFTKLPLLTIIKVHKTNKFIVITKVQNYYIHSLHEALCFHLKVPPYLLTIFY
jgi:hypothetical protein